MSRNQFIKLLEGFCALAKIDNPASILSDGAVTVNNVAFSLMHDEEVPKVLFLYADFGKLPCKQELEVCKALMEANLFLFFMKQQCSFAISQNTRNVTLACRVSMENLTPEDLRTILVELSTKAHAWRKNHFFDLKPKPAQPGRGAFFHALQ